MLQTTCREPPRNKEEAILVERAIVKAVAAAIPIALAVSSSAFEI